MFGLALEQKPHETPERVIRTGLIGTGQMGTDIVAQVSLMPSQEIVIAADIDLQRAVQAYAIAGHPADKVATASTLDEANAARTAGKFVATTDYRLITDGPQLDAVIESTGHPEIATRASLRTIFQRKHIITMSVEMDITVGPLVNWYAKQHGVIYAIGAGDEPAALYELYDFAKALGLTIVAGGKGKNNPLNRDAVPEDLADVAARRGLTPEMLIEFVDGSKTEIEMACVSNATGMVTDCFGMHGPTVNVDKLMDVFKLKKDGGILSQNGVVDYMIGDLRPGVFLVFTTDHPRLKAALIQRDMGNGPNYVLLRPYHLCSMEVPLSVAQAVIQGKSTMQPMGNQLITEVVTVAKCDLEPGRVLERIGGHTHYCMADRFEHAKTMNALPAGISKDCTMIRPVKKGDVITYADVELPQNSVVIMMRRLQDAWGEGKISEADLLREINKIVLQYT